MGAREETTLGAGARSHLASPVHFPPAGLPALTHPSLSRPPPRRPSLLTPCESQQVTRIPPSPARLWEKSALAAVEDKRKKPESLGGEKCKTDRRKGSHVM